MPTWQSYSSIAGGAVTDAPRSVPAGSETSPSAGGNGGEADTAVCAVSGKRYPKREMIQYEGKWISAEHRDEYFQRLREGVATAVGGAMPGPYGYGGFWRRFCAQFVDSVILWIIGMLSQLLFGMIFGLSRGAALGARPTVAAVGFLAVTMTVSIVINFCYYIYFIRKFDATPGKMALGLKLLRSDGSKLSIGRIIGRMFAHGLSALILFIGYIMAAFDEEKRALHDRICDTRVIKTRQ